jgi:hypothetical protein
MVDLTFLEAVDCMVALTFWLKKNGTPEPLRRINWYTQEGEISVPDLLDVALLAMYKLRELSPQIEYVDGRWIDGSADS